ncbi:aldo/keto reductase [Niallia sp. 03133]|uniref:aldo/keto reductase n=1 Tax=Niallia sp. 03133 TaxID=3458060 RepID=UPI004043A5B4
MEYTAINGINKKTSRIGLGTWPIGGMMWGGTNDEEAINLIHYALDNGVTVVDTADDYGLGHSEEVVGKALKEIGKREEIILTSKSALDWQGKKLFRNGSKERVMNEIDATLKRLQTDYLDVYFVHWPDPALPMQETAEAMKSLYEQGKIHSIGVSNFSIEQMEMFKEFAPIHAIQPPYNIFEREAEGDVFPYSKEENATLFLYSSLCRGLLSGKMTSDRVFHGDDMRKNSDPKFQQPKFNQYIEAANKLEQYAQEAYNRPLIDLAVRFVLDKSETGIALRGARRPDQLETINRIDDWHLTLEDFKKIEEILTNTISEPIQPDFMAPPLKKEALHV